MKEKVILQTMTGDEFKKYIEQRNPNGEIDTLPEVLKALKGLRDDETIKDYLDRMVYEAHLYLTIIVLVHFIINFLILLL